MTLSNPIWQFTGLPRLVYGVWSTALFFLMLAHTPHFYIWILLAVFVRILVKCLHVGESKVAKERQTKYR